MKWKCDVCMCSWDDSLLQCGACEAPKPGVKQADIDKAKKDLASLFMGSQASAASSSTSIFVSAASPGSGFTFGVPASFNSQSSGFTFGAPPSGPGITVGVSAAATSGGADTGAGFVFKPTVDKNIKHAEKNKKPAHIAASMPKGTLAGDVFVNGSGECDQLGLGENVLEKKKPTMIKTLKVITQISVGCLHSLAISADGLVFSWGCNDDGVLGRKGEENVPSPIDFSGTAVQVSAGGCHSGLIAADGSVWQWGSFKDSNGHIGFPDFSCTNKTSTKEKKAFKPVRIPSIHKATQLASGIDYMVCLAGSSVFSWGDNMCAQLGQNIRTPEQPAPSGDDAKDEQNVQAWKKKKIAFLFPAPVVLPKSDTHVTSIGTGGDYTFIVTKDKEVYGCGLNGDYQLGIGRRSEAETRFQLIEGLTGLNVAEISGGTSHSVARTVEGQVYTWGRMDRCGVNSTSVTGVEKPRRIAPEAFGNRVVVSARAACGGSHTVALTREGDVYTWGSGDVNQLANCPRDVYDFTDEEKNMDNGDDELTPYLVSSKALEQRHIFAVGAGAQHTCLLAWDKSEPALVPAKRPLTEVADEVIALKRPRRVLSKVEVASPDIFVEAIDRVWRVPIDAMAHTRGSI